MALSNRLQREPAARALAAQFVLLKVVTEDRDTWVAWTRKYKFEGTGIPLLFIVRADGKQLYGKSGAPQALPQFLAAALRQSGRILSPRDLAKLSRDLQNVQAAVKAGENEKAAAILVRSNADGAFAEPALQLKKVAGELTAKALAALKAAEKKLGSKETAFDGVLDVTRIEREYGKLPDLRKPITAALTAIRKDAALRGYATPAKLADRAQQYEAEKKLPQALSTWKLVQSQHPRIALAGARIAELEKQGVATTKPVASKPKSTTISAQERRAQSQLTFGKLLLKRNKSKAREYFERAVKLAPDSAAAAEARELLQQLK